MVIVSVQGKRVTLKHASMCRPHAHVKVAHPHRNVVHKPLHHILMFILRRRNNYLGRYLSTKPTFTIAHTARNDFRAGSSRCCGGICTYCRSSKSARFLVVVKDHDACFSLPSGSCVVTTAARTATVRITHPKRRLVVACRRSVSNGIMTCAWYVVRLSYWACCVFSILHC